MTGFDDQIWRFKRISKHMKGFNMSTIMHMRKNQGFSELKFNDNASQTACLYDPYIFRT